MTDKYDLVYSFLGIECEVIFKSPEGNITTVYGTIDVKTSRTRNTFFINDTEYPIENLYDIKLLKA